MFLGSTECQQVLEAINPKIGDYEWAWKIMRRRMRATGLIPKRLATLLRRLGGMGRPYFIGRTAEGIAFVGDVRDNYALHCQMIPDYDNKLTAFMCKTMDTRTNQRKAREPGHYLDVGTNLGIVAATMARHLQGRAEVLAFEPVPETVQRAAATFALNGLNNVRLFPIAISDVNTEIPFFVATHHSEGASAIQNAYVRQHGFSETRVMCRTLDSLMEDGSIAGVGMLKIDVEGYEPAVARGARALIARHCPPILYEYHPQIAPSAGWKAQDVADLIAQAGAYRFRVLHDDGQITDFEPNPTAFSASPLNIYCDCL